MSADARISLSRRLKWRLEDALFGLFAGAMRLLDVETASNFGAWALSRLGPKTGTEKTVQRNLRLAFPDLSEAERKALSVRHWAELGRLVAEFPLMDRITVENGRIVVEGMERLHAIRDSGRPSVMVSGHFSNWEAMAAAIVASGAPTQITYRAANNPLIDKRIIDSRAAYGVQLFAPKGGDGARDLMTGMKRGLSVALLNDQKFSEGPDVSFFGHPANTATGPSRLAQRFGCPIQPITVERIGPARLKVVIHPTLTVPGTGDRAADVVAATQAITDLIEGQIRARPWEWFWTHKRWPPAVYAALDPA